MTKTAKKALPVNRNYKDTVFRMLFQDRNELLGLYNALNGTHYQDASALEITTLENAIYMKMKNDISFIVDSRMELYEHQSTINPNMPLRDLLYVAALYEKHLEANGLDPLTGKRISLPAPHFIVFYNGTEPQPDIRIMRLSESFEVRETEPGLELTVIQYNINAGHNKELLDACKTLKDYSSFIALVRQFAKTMPRAEAVNAAVEKCIKEHILEDFLRKNRAEVISMSILFEYNEALHEKTLRQEGWEDGRSVIITKLLQNGLSCEEVSRLTEIPLTEIRALSGTLN